jgi:hypothetical protein
MRSIIAKAAALAVFLVLLGPTSTFAQDYITDASEALQHSPVYIVPTDNDTSAKLQAILNNGDNIVLVMLPASAEQELGTDPLTIASRLSEKLGNQRIIGLAIGNKVVAFAPNLPAGVATDLMRRANSVSNDPVTALTTFVQNVHIWLTTNPYPTPTPTILPSASTTEDGSSWLFWLILVTACIVVISAVYTYIANHGTTSGSTEKIHFRAPNPIKDLLSQVASDRELVNDGELKTALYQMCLDIQKYFTSSSRNKQSWVPFFRDRLTEVIDVLTKYIDIQQNPRYYDEAQTELRRGKKSIMDFSQYVLDSIRRGNADELRDYKVNTNILQAQRYE